MFVYGVTELSRQAEICIIFEGPCSLSLSGEGLPGNTRTKPLPHSADLCVKGNSQREPGREQRKVSCLQE